MTVRATSGVPNEVIQYVAEVAEPTPVELPPNESPETFIKAICGAFTNEFAEIFYELNGGETFAREPKKFPRDVRLPACLKWRSQSEGARGQIISGVPAQVLAGETLDAVLVREIGVQGGERLTCSPDELSSRCNKTFTELTQELDPGKNLASLKEGDRVLLPLVTRLATFKLKDEKVQDGLSAQKAADTIDEIAKQYSSPGAIVDSKVALPIRLLDAVPLEKIKEEACREPAKASRAPWPYDARLIEDIINRTWDAKVDKPRRAIITVIDTGLDPKVPLAFPPEFLFLEPPNKAHYGGAAYLGEGRYGPPHTGPHGFHKDATRLHGTYVALIATGGSGLRELLGKSKRLKLSELLGINVYNLVSPIERDGATVWTINESGVGNGVSHAAATGAPIANISIGSETKLSLILSALHKNMLLVVAAGNDNEAFDSDYKLFPAFYGGTHTQGGSQVITVGAHHGGTYDGSKWSWKAEFSNWGRDNVDLLAPGCAVPFSTSDSGAEYGTSFAAPLVSMAAGLLYAFGVESPGATKVRLHAAVDYDPDLEQLVAWSGRLNIPKALSLYDDFLERRSQQKPTLGKWIVPGNHTHVKLCADNEWWNVNDIRKITSLSASAPYRIRFLYFDGDTLRSETCIAGGPGFQFTAVDEKGVPVGDPFNVPWSDLLDFVKHEFPRAPAFASK